MKFRSFRRERQRKKTRSLQFNPWAEIAYLGCMFFLSEGGKGCRFFPWTEALVAAPGSTRQPSDLTDIQDEQEAVIQQLGYLPSNFVRVSAWSCCAENNDDISSIRKPLAIQTYPLQGGAKRRQAKASIGDTAVNDHSDNKHSSNIQSPFPTLFWLASADLSKAVADLERRGFIQECSETIQNDHELARRLLQCHYEYADLRWNSLANDDRALLLLGASLPCAENDDDETSKSPLHGMRNILQYSGIFGTNTTGYLALKDVLDAEHNDIACTEPLEIPPIKCLHAHFAHYLSCSNEFGNGMELILEGRYGLVTNPVGEMVREQLLKEFPDLGLLLRKG